MRFVLFALVLLAAASLGASAGVAWTEPGAERCSAGEGEMMPEATAELAASGEASPEADAAPAGRSADALGAGGEPRDGPTPPPPRG